MALLTADQILSKVKDSGLKDSTCAVQATTSIGDSKSTVALDQQGTVKLTTSPHRSDFLLTTSVLGTSLQQEQIYDTTATYTQTSGASTWKQQPATTSGILSADPLSYGSLTQVTLVDKPTVNGYVTYHLKHALSQAAGLSGATELWVRQDNFYPVKITDQSSTSLQGSTYSINATMTCSAWNTRCHHHAASSEPGRAGIVSPEEAPPTRDIQRTKPAVCRVLAHNAYEFSLSLRFSQKLVFS